MTAKRNPAGRRGLENSAGGRVRFYPTGADDIAPEINLPEWSRGFHACWDLLAPILARVEHERDRYYYELYNGDEVKQRHREMMTAFTVALNRASTAERWAELDRIAADRVSRERREVAR